MKKVGPVEAGINELGDRLLALFAQGQEGRVGREPRHGFLRLLRLCVERRCLSLAAGDLVVRPAVEQQQQRQSAEDT